MSFIEIQERIDSAKYVHLMHNDKFVKPFVDFLNKNFDNSEHIVLCKRSCKQHPFPIGNNVFETESYKPFVFDKVDKVFCHSLFDIEVVDYLYNHKDILKNKSYWVIWGGDLYNARRDEKNDYVRSNFKGYLTDFDTDVAKDKYNLYNKNFYCIHAIFPITKKMIENTTKLKKDFIQIQINNSCDDSTLQMLDVLSRFKDENIKITTILSYGKMQFKDEIINKGKSLFGNKFIYIDSYLPPEDYAQFIAQNDILILNQNRQQGIGNTIASLALGKKVFIRSDISTYKKLKDFNIKVYDTNKITDINFKDFIENNNFKNNQTFAIKFFDENYKASLWKAVFDAK